MKTMPLEEIARNAVAELKLPRVNVYESASIRIAGIRLATLCQYATDEELKDAALLAHFYNHGPELVEILKRVDSCWNEDTGQKLERIIGTTTCNMIHALLAKASTVQMS